MFPRGFSGIGSALRRSILVFLLIIASPNGALGYLQDAEFEGGYRSEANEQASTPPRGWNSYDSFSWLITEEEFLQNAQFVSQNLLQHGYEYVVVDFLWYRKNESGATIYGGEDVIDEWGRLQPDPARWPSSSGGRGFAEVAEKVHSLGLKFGIHVMRGISMAAVNENSPILGAQGQKADSIARLDDKCAWMPNSFVGVNVSTPAGRTFILSLYEQYASWGVDFVKHDCVFGEDLELDEITAVSESIAIMGRPMSYSLSPGVGSSPLLAARVGRLVNFYRVTGDTWDQWEELRNHFDVARDYVASGLLQAPGLQGYSWPDLDMLPLGRLTDPGSQQGPHRSCNLTPDEQRSLMTLWAIAKSPLFYGGDLRSIDPDTLSLITNSVALEVNAYSKGNMEISIQGPRDDSMTPEDRRVWVATGSSGETYMALFNLGDKTMTIKVAIERTMDALEPGKGEKNWQCTGVEAWTNQTVQIVDGVLSADVPSHGSFLYSFNCS